MELSIEGAIFVDNVNENVYDRCVISNKYFWIIDDVICDLWLGYMDEQRDT